MRPTSPWKKYVCRSARLLGDSGWGCLAPRATAGRTPSAPSGCVRARPRVKLRPMLIRREIPGDERAITRVHTAAFAPGDNGTALGAELVDQLRADGDTIAALSLVAEIHHVVVGHGVGSRAHIDDSPSVGLGPLGVLPTHQQHGVGSALMHAVRRQPTRWTSPRPSSSASPLTTADSASSWRSRSASSHPTLSGNRTSRSARSPRGRTAGAAFSATPRRSARSRLPRLGERRRRGRRRRGRRWR